MHRTPYRRCLLEPGSLRVDEPAARTARQGDSRDQRASSWPGKSHEPPLGVQLARKMRTRELDPTTRWRSGLGRRVGGSTATLTAAVQGSGSRPQRAGPCEASRVWTSNPVRHEVRPAQNLPSRKAGCGGAGLGGSPHPQSSPRT